MADDKGISESDKNDPAASAPEIVKKKKGESFLVFGMVSSD